ncbi:unnamed protein product [Schistosoma margrebowiei]|uniref:Uncharacterized protein n=2 Tax=Schistosoma margrebowiei TaxID=48269 RepID=A0A3P8DJ75_9TREM|nr:unnamed protein product [Schistosoma margrebowiei]
MGLVSWMYLHLRVDVHSGTRTQYRSLQTPSRYIIIFYFAFFHSILSRLLSFYSFFLLCSYHNFCYLLSLTFTLIWNKQI